LDVKGIQALIEPILRKLVNENNDAAFDQIAVPLLEVEKRIPGVSDFAGRTIAILDIADLLVGPQSGSDTVRTILTIYRGK
jgi:hypothetical protein